MDETIKYAKMCMSLPEEITSNHKYQEGNYYIGIYHVCTNESFYRDAIGGDRWKSVMHSRDNEICIEMVDDSEYPNHKVNCGHNMYSKVYPLFNQSQLQEMIRQKVLNYEYLLQSVDSVDKEGFVNRVILKAFHNFLNEYETSKDTYNYILQFDSIEQLTLAFVMHENYNMILKNSKWIKNEV